MQHNDNDDNDYREEEGRRRHQQRLERALINTDRDYPDAYHRQDVEARFARRRVQLPFTCTKCCKTIHVNHEVYDKYYAGKETCFSCQ